MKCTRQLCALGIILAACGGQDGSPTTDLAPPASGSGGAGPLDASAPIPDASLAEDAAARDAGAVIPPSDASPTTDATPPPTPDGAASLDAGEPPDAPTPLDAGPDRDSGPAVDAAPEPSPSCDCQRVGDPGFVFDTTRFDTRFAAMPEWALAGVEGGIPCRADTPVVATVSPEPGDTELADDIQAAIDQAQAAGGGVVLLGNGTYPLGATIDLRSNVILRGESRGGVTLEVFLRFRGASDADKIPVLRFDGVERAGLEDLTMLYNADYQGEQMYPLDRDWAFDFFVSYDLRSQDFENEKVFHDRANYLFHDAPDLYVDFVNVRGDSRNSWIDNCSFLDAGSNPIVISRGSEHITLRDNLVEGAFYKGGNGNGYGINCSGRYVLMTGNTVRRTRHWAIQQGAEYCVAIDNHSEVDINFHQGDLGNNLVESNTIHIPYWHLWEVFQTGADFHGDPGTENAFFNNDCIQRSEGPLYADDAVYTFVVREIAVLSPTPPSGGTLYALACALP